MEKKVVYAKCENYKLENVDKAIEFLISNIDNFEDRVKKAKKILIKPNLLSAKVPEKAITTHPQVLISLINHLKKYNAEIIIADTPAGKINDVILNKLYTTCQMKKVAEETGITLNTDLSDVSITSEAFKIGNSYNILRVVKEADLIINFAKLKTHSLTTVTLSTKNMYGTIPGLIKIQYHMTMSDIDIFTNMLLDLQSYYADKTIHFIDGILGMEGNGPSNGEPVEAKCILAGTNPVYLDILACQVMGINPQNIPIFINALKRNIVSSLNYEDLEIISNEPVQTYNFKVPLDRKSAIPHIVPEFVRAAANNFFIPKPVVNKDKCIGCKACEEMCAPQVMKVKDKVASITNYNKCIRCYCCQEVCPENAIDLVRPLG